MSVNWKWDDKVGEIVYERTNGKGTFSVSIYLANCLGCLIQGRKGSRQFAGFFSDKAHLERCLGLRKSFNGYKSNIVDSYYLDAKIREVRFTRYTKETKDMIDCFIRANHKVSFTPKKTKKQ